MSEMIERVARAMCESDDAGWDAGSFRETANGDEPEEQREYWREKARVAVAALRGPSNDMTVIGWKIAGERDAVLGNGEIAMIWDAMIDTALGPTP